jgi:hypothetical protein
MGIEDTPTGTRDSRRVKRFLAAAFLLIVGSMACRQGKGPEVFPFDRRTGWFHGACLAISDPNLARGTAINLVVMGEPQRVIEGRVGEQISSAASCAPLTEGRRNQNAKPGTSFYGLEGTELGASDMGIGIVAPPQKPVVVNGLAKTDLNSDGRPEIFSSCTTTEGINFAVSTEKPYQGTPLWSAYYYLGYDLEPTCH